MKVGITGASGFLGQAIAREAAERGWEPVAFSRHPERGVTGAGEVRDLAGDGPLDLEGLEAVVHLAAEPIVGLWTAEKRRAIRESRARLTARVVEGIAAIPRSRRPEALVSASAVGYYGDRGDEWLDEEADLGFGFLPEVCRDWEAAAMRAARLGTRVVTPRVGIVLGDGGFLAALRPVFRLGLGGRLGPGTQWMSWIHLSDLARVFCQCLASPSLRGRVNCTSPNPVTNRDFTAAYAAELRRPARFAVPRFALGLLPGGMASLFLDSQRAEPVALKAEGFEWDYPEIAGALAAAEQTRREARESRE